MDMSRFLTLFCVVLVSCSEKKDDAASPVFNFDKLIDEQVSQLSQRRLSLDKSARVDGDHADSTFVPTPEHWTAELDIFRHLQVINKPIYQNLLRLEEPLEDLRSNLHVRQYTVPASPYILLKIFYQDEPNRMKKIEATIAESNKLYSNRRDFAMEFDEQDGRLLLTGYEIRGFQKVALRDTVRFAVKGKINW